MTRARVFLAICMALVLCLVGLNPAGATHAKKNRAIAVQIEANRTAYIAQDAEALTAAFPPALFTAVARLQGETRDWVRSKTVEPINANFARQDVDHPLLRLHWTRWGTADFSGAVYAQTQNWGAYGLIPMQGNAQNIDEVKPADVLIFALRDSANGYVIDTHDTRRHRMLAAAYPEFEDVDFRVLYKTYAEG